MKDIIINNISIVNDGKIFTSSVKIIDGIIQEINNEISPSQNAATIIDGTGLHLLPGLIDDQVHFREPGLTHKGCIHSESKAAVAGGITSFMEMPNTKPQCLNQELLENKYEIGAKDSFANYSFFMGASNDNMDEVLKRILKMSVA